MEIYQTLSVTRNKISHAKNTLTYICFLICCIARLVTWFYGVFMHLVWWTGTWMLIFVTTSYKWICVVSVTKTSYPGLRNLKGVSRRLVPAVACWSLWKERNSRAFNDHMEPSLRVYQKAKDLVHFCVVKCKGMSWWEMVFWRDIRTM